MMSGDSLGVISIVCIVWLILGGNLDTITNGINKFAEAETAEETEKKKKK